MSKTEHVLRRIPGTIARFEDVPWGVTFSGTQLLASGVGVTPLPGADRYRVGEGQLHAFGNGSFASAVYVGRGAWERLGPD